MIKQLVAALEQKFQDLSVEEMADILWLTLQQWQSEASPLARVESVGNDPLKVLDDDSPVLDGPSPVPSPSKVTSPEPSRAQDNAAAGVTTQSDKATEARSSSERASPLAVPDSTALRRSLDILKAIRPLIRSVPSAERMYLDVPATVQAIAETDVWSLQLRPVPEPWLELALVIDTTPSMVIWQRTILKLRRVLAQSGVFRDVRLWSLETADNGQTVERMSEPNSPQRLCLRSGYGVRTVRQAPCRPQELLDPNRRRLILVVSDCIDPRWDEQPVRDMLQVWASAGPMGLVQVLPEWLWGRTALSEVTKGQMVAQRPGQPSQSLRFVRRDRWRRKPTIGIKVPVMTLEPVVASRWSQMVAGQSSVSSPGLVFSPVTVQQFPPELAPNIQQSLEDSAEPSAKERMTHFRDFSSPMARRLAGLLAACPEVNLPVVRMVQAAVLPESQQVHVAEVLLGGLFKPHTDITAHTPAAQVQYTFHDGVRPLVQNTVPPDFAFAALSEWLNQRFGCSLEDFQAYITTEGTGAVEPFAGVLLNVLKRRGRDYADIIDHVERVYQPQYATFTELTEQARARQDYEIRARVGESGVAVLAIHGGNLWPGTTQLADIFAGDFHSFYSFVSLRPEGDQTLFVPSTHFDEPVALEIVGAAETVVSIDGCEGDDEFIRLGGLNSALQEQIRAGLIEEGFDVIVDDLIGTDPSDICNRCESGRGIKLQISRGLCRRLVNADGTVQDAERFGPSSSLQENLRSLAWLEDDITEDAIDFPELETFEFVDAQLVVEEKENESVFPPPLQTETFTVVTFEQDAPLNMVFERFDFTVVTLGQKLRLIRSDKWNIQRQQKQNQYIFIEHLPGNLRLEMIPIPRDTFLMGVLEDGPSRYPKECPQHEVTVDSFILGRYPVTQSQWRAVANLPLVNRELDPAPSRFQGERHPVEQVSWYDAVEFCNRLSNYTGRDYRLPTEAEWEYACRAGTSTPFHFGDMITTEVANYNGSAYAEGPKGKRRGETTPVDYFAGIANAFGLSDMHGNVYEWCGDHWHRNYWGAPDDGSAWLTDNEEAARVVRGGSWLNIPRFCRSTYRTDGTPESRHGSFGFRVSCSSPRT